MNLDKLAKVLAMAASDNETEALHALRTARRLLEAEGADFVELAGRLSGAPGGVAADRLHDTIFDLRNEVRHLRSENERLKRSPGAEAPGGLGQRAEAEATVIRLRAALAETSAQLENERAEALQLRAALAFANQRVDEATAESRRLAEGEGEGRGQRLEAENRRLSLLAQALRAEVDEAKTPRAPAPQSPLAVAPRRSAGRKGKAQAQYALF
jgi:hypothetical protein